VGLVARLAVPLERLLQAQTKNDDVHSPESSRSAPAHGRRRSASCGSRFVTGALNRSRTVLLQGEIPWEAMDNAVRFLSETTGYFTSVAEWAASWQQNRRALLYALWGSMVKGRPRAVRATIAWFGHKTPRHDRYWAFYPDFLDDASPKYVFA
jgi:hypothetical protein